MKPTPFTRLVDALLTGRRWVVLAMLVALHAALVAAPGSDFQRVWLLVQFGPLSCWGGSGPG